VGWHQDALGTWCASGRTASPGRVWPTSSAAQNAYSVNRFRQRPPRSGRAVTGQAERQLGPSAMPAAASDDAMIACAKGLHDERGAGDSPAQAFTGRGVAAAGARASGISPASGGTRLVAPEQDVWAGHALACWMSAATPRHRTLRSQRAPARTPSWPATPAGSPHADDRPFHGLRSTPAATGTSCTEDQSAADRLMITWGSRARDCVRYRRVHD
jgi:hypothetical protein